MICSSKRCIDPLYELGWNAFERKDWPAMVAAYRRGHDIARATWGEGSRQHAAWSLNLGEALLDQEKPAEALPVLEAAYAMFDARGTPSPELAVGAVLLGRALRDVDGPVERVKELFARAARIYRDFGFEEDARFIEAEPLRLP